MGDSAAGDVAAAPLPGERLRTVSSSFEADPRRCDARWPKSSLANILDSIGFVVVAEGQHDWMEGIFEREAEMEQVRLSRSRSFGSCYQTSFDSPLVSYLLQQEPRLWTPASPR